MGEFNDPRLSSGNLLYSGNAMPIPQLRLGIFDYAPFWGTNGWFSVKGYISYGMFTDSGWQKSWAAPGSKRTEDVLYHSKGLWLRGGNTSKFPLQAVVGIEMATQFGGKSFKDGKELKMGSGLKQWLNALFPMSTTSENFDGEVVTVEGNMLGAYNISLSWLPDADWSVTAYYEHFFEDHSQMTFEYGWKDGLWGVEVQLPRNPFVSSFVYEYLYSKAGPEPCSTSALRKFRSRSAAATTIIPTPSTQAGSIGEWASAIPLCSPLSTTATTISLFSTQES